MNLNNIDLRKNFFFSDHWFRVSPCEDTYGDGWNGGFLKIGQTEQFCGEFESAGTVGKFDVSEAGMVSNLFFKKKKIKKKKSNWANIGCKNEEVKFQTVTHSQGNEVMWEVLGTECKVESMGNDATDEQMCCLAQQTYEVQCKDASGSNFVQWSSQNFHFFWITINPTHRVNQEKKTRFILLRWSLGGWKYVNHWGQNILYRFWSQQQRRIWSRKRRKNQ